MVTAPTAAVCKIIKIENLQLGQPVQNVMLVSLGQSDSVGGCLVKMRVRRVTVWKHEKFTIIPRKRWQNLTLQELIETLVVSVDCVDNGDVYWSLFSFLSMESVDQVGRRERFMQSNFESLSGGDDGTNSAATNSISNAWREGGSSAHQRNAGTIGEIIVNLSIYHQYSQYSQYRVNILSLLPI